MSSFILFSAAILFIFFGPQQTHAFDASAYFDKSCSSCHSVGFGDDVGPDLKGVTERRTEKWLLNFIKDSQGVIQTGDPIAVELFNKYRKKKMPEQDLSDGEIRALLNFIARGGPGEKPLDAKAASEATKAELAFGAELFLGTKSFNKGGPACISCHSVGNFGPLGGGTLGLNLSQVYSKYEDRGLSKALAKAAFPVMREIYAERPLTTEEAFAVKAFLFEADKSGTVSGNYQKKFLFLGLSGVVVAMGIIDFIWRKRRKKTVKPMHGGHT